LCSTFQSGRNIENLPEKQAEQPSCKGKEIKSQIEMARPENLAVQRDRINICH